MEDNQHKVENAAPRQKFVIALVLLLAGLSFQISGQTPATAPPQTGPASRAYVQNGLSIECSIDQLSPRKNNTTNLLAGTEAIVRIRIVDANEGKPVSNLHPSAWIDRRDGEQITDARGCREKIQAFLQPSFSKRPSVDLNTYFILALNHEANISVIDPLSGFGGSKLYNLIALRSSGEDWVLSADKKSLYVSMPASNGVAVIDTATWKLIANLDSGIKPTRLALQDDGRYLWVANDAPSANDSGVTVIDTKDVKVVARLKTGAGHHEIAFAADDSFAFITNKQDGTLSVVDVRKLSKLTDIKIGGLPSGAVLSPLSKAIYVANENDGTIAVVEAERHEILNRIKTEPGLKTVRFAPDGRFGFAINPATNRVYIFDVSSNRLIQVVPVDPGADQIAFTKEFAYVRSTGSEFVTMIKITDLEKESEAAITHFPAGQKTPKESNATAYADAIVPAPESGAVLVANPADKMIYYYTEGMAAPMGSFSNYQRDPKALLVLDNSLKETSRGVYTTTVRLPAPGRYDVALLVDSPRVSGCFDMAVAENTDLPQDKVTAVRVEPLVANPTLRVGESYNLRFKVIELESKTVKTNLEDIGVLVFLTPGIWQQRVPAKSVGQGVYEVNFVPPKTGVYYIYFQIPSLGLHYSQIQPLALQAANP